MSPPAHRDRETEGRFAAWLARRDADLATEASADLDTLAELGGLVQEGASFAGILTGAGLDDETVERLLKLHSAWTRFRRHEREQASGIAWVGERAAAASPEKVTWVGADPAAVVSGAPSGPVPSLLGRGARALRPELPKGGGWRISDLFVPLCLFLTTLLLLVPVAWEGVALDKLRSEALDALRTELSNGARPRRLETQANHAAWLGALRSGQLEVVNATCEGGTWCSERVRELNDSRRLAAELLSEARARGTQPQQGWRPEQQAYTRELSRIQSRLAREEDARPESRRVLQAEIGWLRAEASR
jgi:hypothetical protein